MPDKRAPSNLSRQAVGAKDYTAIPEEYQPLSIQERIADRIYGGGMQAREGMQGIAEGRPWEAYKIPLGGATALFSPVSAAAERLGEGIATSGSAGLPQLLAGALAQGIGEYAGGSGLMKLIGAGRHLGAAGEKARTAVQKSVAPRSTEGPYVPLHKRSLKSSAVKERRAPDRPTDEEFHANVARAYGERPNPQGLTEAELARRLEPVRGGLEGDLTRPWVGVKPAIGPQGGPLNIPKSYRSPKTYDLSEYE